MAISKNEIKYVQSLSLKKYRQRYNCFIAEGEKIASEVLVHTPRAIQKIYALPDWIAQQAALLLDLPARVVEPISATELEKISTLSTPNQVLMILDIPPSAEITSGYERVLYLDDIQDPGNFGSILRIADWFGIPAVYCSPGSVDMYNPKVVQATMGAFLRVRSVEIPLAELKAQLPSLPVVGAVLDGDDVYAVGIPRKGVLVIGNESRGISPYHQSLLSHRLTIPRGPSGGAESLNAAIATGILCALWDYPLRDK
jgi:RNA methyltransferase, TrmH family